MPATVGVDFIVRIGNERQTLTLSGGGGADTYRLNFEGQQTTDIVETAAASAVQSALEALSTIGAGNVAVAGAAGGPYTVTFQGALAGQDVNALTVTNTTGGLAVAVATIAPTWQTLGGQRGGRLRRTTDEADLTNKDAPSWHDGAPTIRHWAIEADTLIIEDNPAVLALENAYINRRRVHVDMQTPAANNYTGIATIADFSWDGPHDDALTGSIVLSGNGVLTKS